MDYLQLADWRRHVAALYARVREQAADDPMAAWEDWRATREELYRRHPQSPIPAGERSTFKAFHFAYDPAMRFTVPVAHDAGEAADGLDAAGSSAGVHPAAIPASGGGTMSLQRVGRVDVPFPSGPRHLALYWMPDYGGGLFLSFRDATNGAATYGGGRYLLDGAKSADLGGDPDRDMLTLDFNFAYHPSCAFDPRWVCPLTPAENRLDLPVRAGERLA